jgi:hypothetical protein
MKENRYFVCRQHVHVYYLLLSYLTIFYACIIYRFILEMFYIRMFLWIISVETQNSYEGWIESNDCFQLGVLSVYLNGGT